MTFTDEELDDILERHGWRDEEDRAAALAETAARQKRIDYESAVARALQEQAERKLRDEQQERDRIVAERRAAIEADRKPEQDEPKMSSNVNTEGWQRWISGEIKAQQKAATKPLLEAIGDVMGEYVRDLKDQIASERDGRQKLEVETAVVKQELAALKTEVAELRGELKTRSALADMEARLARMEAPSSPARLKTIAG